jgi:uncharacterized membrane protein
MRHALALASLLVFGAFPLLASGGCTVLELDQTPCPTGGTKLTYENFGKAFFTGYCNTCHSAPDGERRGAPEAYVFGTADEIRVNKVRIFRDSAGTNDSMPPGPDDPPLEQRDMLAEWLACGAP